MTLFISTNNSTTVPLLANQSFIGQTDALQNWQELDLNIAGAPSVAPGILYFEFSPDNGLHWDVSIPLTLTGPSMVPVILRSVLPWFRIRYVNGNTDLTEFRLTTTLHRISAIRLTRFLNQAIDFNEPVEMVRIAKGERSYETNTSSVNASVTNVNLLLSNQFRIGATIFNDSSNILYVKLGNVASLINFTVKILAGGYYETPYNYNGNIDGIWDVASGTARITEIIGN